MRFRKLRVVWSVLCGVACVLLIVLWVRSERLVEMYSGLNILGGRLVIGSMPGVFDFGIDSNLANAPAIRIRTDAKEWWSQVNKNGSPPYSSRIWGLFSYNNYIVLIPFWFGVAFAFVAAALPWLHLHFSLRTLLIATTLVAGVLGLAVYAAKL